MKFTQIMNQLNKSSKVAIFVHLKPDADCLGSAIALGSYLRNHNKSVDFFCDDDIHDNYKIITTQNFKKYVTEEYDLLVAVDCSNVSRIGSFEDYFDSHPNTINIDHHYSNTNYANLNLVCSEVSTTVVLYKLFKNTECVIDKCIASALYAGIIGDTGGLTYGDLTSEVFNIVGELVDYGVDIQAILYNLLRRRTFNQQMLLKAALGSLQLDKNIASIAVTLKDFKATNTSLLDVFGIVNYANNLDVADIAVCLCEYLPNKFQVSIRSRGAIDCTKVANMFGGGGHRNASGCRIFGTLDSCLEQIKKAVRSL